MMETNCPKRGSQTLIDAHGMCTLCGKNEWQFAKYKQQQQKIGELETWILDEEAPEFYCEECLDKMPQ